MWTFIILQDWTNLFLWEVAWYCTLPVFVYVVVILHKNVFVLVVISGNLCVHGLAGEQNLAAKRLSWGHWGPGLQSYSFSSPGRRNEALIRPGRDDQMQVLREPFSVMASELRCRESGFSIHVSGFLGGNKTHNEECAWSPYAKHNESFGFYNDLASWLQILQMIIKWKLFQGHTECRFHHNAAKSTRHVGLKATRHSWIACDMLWTSILHAHVS